MADLCLYNLASPLVAAFMIPRAVCSIDLDALTHNFGEVRRLVGPEVRICCVVKAQAYGHGAVPIGRTLARAGAHALAVTSFDEARELRDTGVDLPILILSGIEPSLVTEAVRLDLFPVVWDAAQLRALAAEAPTGQRLGVHLKFDTGMRRLGADDATDLAEAALTGAISVEGTLSHLACADEPRHASVEAQLEDFRAILRTIEAAGVRPGIRHLANSAGMLADARTHLDMVRPGLLLYGCHPQTDGRSPGSALDLRPVMEFKTKILHVKDAPSGAGVGYGWTFETRRPSRLAVLAIGYGQGYPRALSNRAEVSVRGHRAPVVGAISMDHTTIDVTDVPDPRIGDEVTLWGGTSGIDAGDLATKAGTISYELLTRVSRDIPRQYEGRNA